MIFPPPPPPATLIKGGGGGRAIWPGAGCHLCHLLPPCFSGGGIGYSFRVNGVNFGLTIGPIWVLYFARDK